MNEPKFVQDLRRQQTIEARKAVAKAIAFRIGIAVAVSVAGVLISAALEKSTDNDDNIITDLD